MRIQVPATSANIGPGFDSCGIAVNQYLVIGIHEPTEQWEIHHDLGAEVPSDADNLLIQTALRVDPSLAPHSIQMVSKIPLARGLGSSSSVIIAGIELANQLSNLQLTNQEKLQLATEIEGHPDNVAPALLGNFTISSYVNGQVQTIVHPFPKCALVGFIPNYELKTSDSRKALPETLPFKTAVLASSIANVMISALLKADLKTAGQMIEADQFHEPFRQRLVPEFLTVRKLAKSFGSYATYLSGAGPTILTLLPEAEAVPFADALSAKKLNGQVELLEVDTEGLKVYP
ncbi:MULTISPECIES: homoserine kinase [unclassified Enterococcus]|uniref:homoserine kinase n=1 Tax=unclassified Enterococcus TaxID=2608891 RepID=UPI0015553045|nr:MULTISPECIES: homoserine kinase [unclassified Enterococcus]MBS7577656.1 homoserine kinase [Enterococcus sp. MMGLQ5-2]MBS7584150.1 homoserine kinase [Enterococcus sp. MMGLQ5-1]NPD12008.1 homoserine kinase [Enterococcus sp. MMGLQ5-1]NPD37489.1 homoserine kinase [Enterococcus sp. MMGLQ5-2]